MDAQNHHLIRLASMIPRFVVVSLLALSVLTSTGCAYRERKKYFSRETAVVPQIIPLAMREYSNAPLEPLPSGVRDTLQRAGQPVPTTRPPDPQKQTPAPADSSSSMRRLPPVEGAIAPGAVGETRPVQAGAGSPSVTPFPLSLSEARAAALAGNLDLMVANYDPQIAEEAVLQEIGRFEATFSGTLNRNRNDPPPPAPPLYISPFGSPPETATDTFQPGVQIPLTSGGVLALRQNRLRSAVPGSTVLPSVYSLAPTLSLQHAILRGAGSRFTTSGIQLAALQRGRLDAVTKLTAIRVLAATEQAYWAAFGAQHQLNILRQQVRLAEEQVSSARKLAAAEVISDVDVLRSEAGLLARQQVVVDAELQLLLRTRELKRVIQMPGLDVESVRSIQIASQPNLVGLSLDRAALARQALQNRLELVDLALQYEQDLVRVQNAENQVLPQLDFVFEGKLLGTAVEADDAATQAWEGEYHDWLAGLSFSLPLAGNRSARAAIRMATLTRAKTMTQQALLKVEIRKQMNDAIDRFEQSWRQILASEQSVAAAIKAYQAEARLFQLGQRTSDLVLIAAGNLADSEMRMIQAVVAFQLSRVDIALATGTMLGYSQIELVPATDSANGETAPPNLVPAPPDP